MGCEYDWKYEFKLWAWGGCTVARLIDADKLCEFANNLNCKSVDANDIMRFPRVYAVPVVRCESCENWDTDSGLTARMCNRLGRYTTRYWFCADGREKHDSDKFSKEIKE